MSLLKAAGETAPFVLVGHSLGGVFARVFAARYPDSVAGLLLIDPTPMDLRLRWTDRFMAAALMQSLPILFRLGLQPLRSQMAPMGRDLPAAARDELMASYGSLAHLEALRDEYRAMFASNAQAKAAILRRDLPVTILSAGRAMSQSQAAMVRQAQAEHARFAEGFVGGRHRVISGSTHLSLVTDPGNAEQVVDEVKTLVERVRSAPGCLA